MAQADLRDRYMNAKYLFEDDEQEHCEDQLLELLAEPALTRELRCRSLILLSSNSGNWHDGEMFRLQAESAWNAMKRLQDEYDGGGTEAQQKTLTALRKMLDQLSKWQEEDIPESLAESMLGGYALDGEGDEDMTGAASKESTATAKQQEQEAATATKIRETLAEKPAAAVEEDEQAPTLPSDFRPAPMPAIATSTPVMPPSTPVMHQVSPFLSSSTPSSSHPAVWSPTSVSGATEATSPGSISSYGYPRSVSGYRLVSSSQSSMVERFPQPLNPRGQTLAIPRGRGNRIVSGRGRVCYTCGRPGHIARTCPNRVGSNYAASQRPDPSRPDLWFMSYPGARVYVLMGEHRVIWQKQTVGLVQVLVGDDIEEISGNSDEATARRYARWDQLKRKEVDGQGYVVDENGQRLARAIPDTQNPDRYREYFDLAERRGEYP